MAQGSVLGMASGSVPGMASGSVPEDAQQCRVSVPCAYPALLGGVKGLSPVPQKGREGSVPCVRSGVTLILAQTGR